MLVENIPKNVHKNSPNNHCNGNAMLGISTEMQEDIKSYNASPSEAGKLPTLDRSARTFSFRIQRAAGKAIDATCLGMFLGQKTFEKSKALVTAGIFNADIRKAHLDKKKGK